MAVTAEQIKEIRHKTGAGMLDCKKALKETDGNLQEAIDWLRKKGMSKAAKRSGREASQGFIASHIINEKTGALVELNCETDFVAKTDGFKGLLNELCVHVAEKSSAGSDTAALMDEKYHKDDSKTVKEVITEFAGTTGENVICGRYSKFVVEGSGAVGSYVHDGRIGVMVELNCGSDAAASNDDFKKLLMDLCLHITAKDTLFLNESVIPEKDVEKEREIARDQMKDSGKPANIIEKIVEGKIAKWKEEVCLMNQPFIHDEDVTVQKVLDQLSKKLGETVTIKQFTKYILGEGE